MQFTEENCLTHYVTKDHVTRSVSLQNVYSLVHTRKTCFKLFRRKEHTASMNKLGTETLPCDMDLTVE